jgi:hypothetical protein
MSTLSLRRLATLAFAALALSSCAVAQRIDSAIDCNGICQRYASCFSSTYDVDACAARCRQSAASDVDFRRKADTCNACISERSCVQATFACVSECVSVVP